MSILDYIRIQKNDKLLLLGISEEGEHYRYMVSEPFYISIGSPTARTLLSEEMLSLIKSESERIRVKKKALSILSYSDNNERSLKQKLVRAGFSREVSEESAREMVSLGYIDEERQLRRLIAREANINLSGYSKLLPKLLAKGYSSDMIRSVTRTLVEEEEINFSDNAKRLIEKRLPEGASSEEKKKLLYKYGYKI